MSAPPSLHQRPTSPATSPLAALYRERRERFSAKADELGRRSARVANQRLLVFLAALAAAGWGIWGDLLLLRLAAGLLAIGFVGLVIHHRRLEQARRRWDALTRINAEAEARVAREWASLPVRHTLRAAPDHPYAADLDLLGPASLLQLLDMTGTQAGELTLGDWLLEPAPPAVVAERQQAVVELAPLVDWRDELTRRGQEVGAERPTPEPLLAWAESAPLLTHRPALLWAARVSPLALALLFVAQQVGLVAYPFWLLALLANLWLSWRLVSPAYQSIELLSSRSAQLQAYADALALVAAGQPTAPLLRRLQETLAEGGAGAAAELWRLQRLTRLAQPRSSMLYPLIELTTLWNVHLLARLERWQTSVGAHVRAWLAALGEAEALAALARLAHDNPDWCFPALDPDARALAARHLAHPLLRQEVRVGNDVEVGPPGTFLLVTGSNMSGKSTLLRAIGLNAVLGQAGGPVCAAELRLPPLAVWTSMRLQDSLEQGVSFFMAELRRLKQIVDAAALADQRRPLLYLLDEILQGTNTAERQIAARRVIRLLLASPAIGAVSTHDLTLAAAPDLAASARQVHLRETVVDDAAGAQMTFDYRLRPGIARTTNALRLLDLVGIPLAAGENET